MAYRVMTYPSKCKETPSFYIQIKGLNSGKPLKNAIVNCVAVYTDMPYLYELVYLLFKGRKFEIHLKGSVIPFVRIEDLHEVIDKGLSFYKPEKLKLLDQVQKVDEALLNCNNKIKLLQQLQAALCSEFLK
jgi:hypothetical protein